MCNAFTMKRQAYISVSYSKRGLIDEPLAAIADALLQFKITPFIFIDHYQFNSTQEHRMMQQAFADLDQSCMLIAEVSDKAIGIGVEAGYAKAKRKPIIYVRHAEAEHSTTIAGTSDHQIIYTSTGDLTLQLKNLLELLLHNKQL